MSTKNYVVTGGARGIGLEITRQLLLRPSSIVVVAIRDPSKGGKIVEVLPKAKDTRLVVLPYDALDDASAHALVKALPQHGVTHIDVLIANSGIHDSSRTLDLTSERAARVITINATAPVVLAGAARELLKKSDAPVFGISTSAAGSIEGLGMLPPAIPSSPYGSSKATVNWYIRRLHFEEPWLATVGVHPGLLDTDMCRAIEMEDGLTFDYLFEHHGNGHEVGIKGYLAILDRAVKDRETIGGRMVNYDGTILPW